MQMFRRPVTEAEEGDRVGLCVSQLDPKQLERGLVCQPNYIPLMLAAIVKVQRIKYFQGHIKSKDRFHISIGHETVMASLSIFESTNVSPQEPSFNLNTDYELKEELLDERHCFMLLQFEKPIFAVPQSLIIGARLEMDINSHACRLAFWGTLAHQISEKNYEKNFLPHLRIFKQKERKGTIERIVKDDTVIVKNLIKKETNAQVFVGLSVVLSSGEKGVIESTFGKSGKLNIHVQGQYTEKHEEIHFISVINNALITDGLKPETIARYKGQGTKRGEAQNAPVDVTLKFKRYVFDSQKKMVQT